MDLKELIEKFYSENVTSTVYPAYGYCDRDVDEIEDPEEFKANLEKMIKEYESTI